MEPRGGARTADAVVIGAGFAGLSTASHLARRGLGRVLVLERESVPGAHASGRNAGLLRRIAGPEPVRALCLAGAAVHREGDLFRRTGSILVFEDEDRARLEADASGCRAAGVEVRTLRPPDVFRLAPLVRGARLDGALHTPADGVVDVHALLLSFLEELRRHGGRLETSTPVVSIERHGDRVAGVTTPAGRIESPIVVDAAGAWAGTIGAWPLPLTSYRRHLFLTGDPVAADPSMPWIWDESGSWYLRPETGRLLLSGCDQSPHPPGAPAIDPLAAERLGAKLLDRLPLARTLTLGRSWACLRTFSPDGIPILGPDPRLSGLFVVAGLGGHGMTASHAVGELAAGIVLGEPDDPGLARALHPERFILPRTHAR